MVRLILLCLLACCVPNHACWFSSKNGAVAKIERYLIKIGHDPKKGLNRGDFRSIVRDAPSGISWAVRKLGSIDGVYARCDQNNDEIVTLDEVRSAPKCLSSCWKTMAISSYLN